MMEERFLQIIDPPKVVVRTIRGVSWTKAKKIASAGKRTKYGFKDFGVSVTQVSEDKFDVYLEYVY